MELSHKYYFNKHKIINKQKLLINVLIWNHFFFFGTHKMMVHYTTNDIIDLNNY